MILLFASFFSSLLLILGIIRYKHLHEHFSGDHDLSGPQKFHQGSVPRIGGLGIYAALWIANFVAYLKDPALGVFLGLILIAAFPVTVTGFTEDITKRIGVKIRLLAGFISGALLLYLFTITSIRIDVWGLDALLLNIWVAVIFLCVACAGLANAYNIIDGFNGLASMVGIISSTAIGFVAFKVGDLALVYLALILIGAVMGFFIWNYPRGLIFLGDGGAYLIGFVIAALSILLVYRNPGVSPWFALLVNAYPIFETLFTIWRRSVHQGKNPGLPDGAHFHSLIYRRVLRWAHAMDRQSATTQEPHHHYLNHAKTSPYLWLISSVGVIPALLFWQSTPLLIASSVFFIAIYIYCYRTIVQRRRPWWLASPPEIDKSS
jgi:UDP-N-acetylmuramyl pentapeptide phosphotransferase/UDP-N-acetylglucosamine-1-phosphate transferase